MNLPIKASYNDVSYTGNQPFVDYTPSCSRQNWNRVGTAQLTLPVADFKAPLFQYSGYADLFSYQYTTKPSLDMVVEVWATPRNYTDCVYRPTVDMYYQKLTLSKLELCFTAGESRGVGRLVGGPSAWRRVV